MSEKGVVAVVTSNDWEDRRKGETIQLYSFKVEGDDTWYRTGQKKPPFEKGQSVSFKVGEKNNVVFDSIEILGTAVKVAPKANGKNGVMSKDDYFREKDRQFKEVDVPRMTFCTSQDAAVALVAACMERDVLPKLDTVAKSARLKAVLGFVDELTDRFYKQRMAANTVTTSEAKDEASSSEDVTKEKSLDD